MNPGLVVKLRPSGPWRIGPDSGARNRVDVIYHSDSLYSAVTSAMSRLGWLEDWLDATARTGSPAVSFSSCFPYLDDVVFVVPPRTVWPPATQSTKAARVRWKSARFVPLTVVQSILSGHRLDENQWSVDGASDCLVPAGQPGPFRTAVRSNAGVDRLTGASERHSTACIEFRAGSGLWTVVSFADQAAHELWSGKVKAAFRLLADTGFGGERSRGWGRSEAPEFTDGMLPDLILPQVAEAEKEVAEAAVIAPSPIAPLAVATRRAEAVEPEAPATEGVPSRDREGAVTSSPSSVEAPVVEATPVAEAPTTERESPAVEAAAKPEPAIEGAPAAEPEAPVAEAPATEPESPAVKAAAEPEPAIEAAPAAEPEAPVAEAPATEPESPAVKAAAEPEPAVEAAPAAEPEAPVAEAPATEPEAPAVEAAAEPEPAVEAAAAAEPEAPVAEAPATEPEAPAVEAAAEPEPAVEAAPAAEPESKPQAAAVAPTAPTHPHWLLSLFTPAPADSVDWRRGNYTVLPRGGRVDSPAGSGELKKQIQMVAEGSVLYAETAPRGSAADVAPDGFAHPVFRAGFAVAIPLPEVR